MREEVNAAVGFLAKFMQRKLSKDSLEQFKQTLRERLQFHYKDHWFPNLPHKGSGYRCIRINSQVMDPLLYSVAQESGIADLSTLRLFPDELTMWVDPHDVSYRIGESGSIGQVDVNVTVSAQQQPKVTQKSALELSLGSSYLEHPRKLLTSCKDQFVRGFSSSQSGRFGSELHGQYVAAFAS